MTALPAKQGGQETSAPTPKEQDFPSLAVSKSASESSKPAGTAWTRPPSQLQAQSSPEELVAAIPLTSANATSSTPTSASAYSIGRTKKGGLPVRVESRSKG